MNSLTDQEVAHYREHGYVVPSFRLSPARVIKLRRALDAVIAANPGVRPERLVSIHTREKGAEGVEGNEIFFELARDEAILDLVEQLIGPDIVMWGCQAFCKPPGNGMEVPWHQDGQYWPIRPLKTCTMWLAIDDADRDNGCLQVIPGSHLGSIHYGHQKETRDKLVLNQSIKDPRLENAEFDYIELKAGQLSLHDVFLVHGSQPNTSGRRRAGFTVRYMPSTAVLRRDIEIPFAGYPVNWKEKPLWLAKGKDVSGKNDLTRGHIK